MCELVVQTSIVMATLFIEKSAHTINRPGIGLNGFDDIEEWVVFLWTSSLKPKTHTKFVETKDQIGCFGSFNQTWLCLISMNSIVSLQMRTRHRPWSVFTLSLHNNNVFLLPEFDLFSITHPITDPFGSDFGDNRFMCCFVLSPGHSL